MRRFLVLTQKCDGAPLLSPASRGRTLRFTEAAFFDHENKDKDKDYGGEIMTFKESGSTVMSLSPSYEVERV